MGTRTRPGPVLLARLSGWLFGRFAADEVEEQGDDEQDEEDEEQDFRDVGRAVGDVSEAEDGGDDGDDEERDGPTEHGMTLSGCGCPGA